MRTHSNVRYLLHVIGLYLVIAAGGVLDAAAAPKATDGQAQAMTVQDNKQVMLDYTLTVDDQQVDASTKERPFRYIHGQHQIIPGLEEALSGLAVGDSKQVTVGPEKGYGQPDPRGFVQLERSRLPAGQAPQVGMMLRGSRPDGGAFAGRITNVTDSDVTLDLNHPLAGKTLVFQVTVTSITDAPKAP